MPTSKSISGFQRRADLRFFLSIIAAGLLSFTGVVIETAMNITFPTLMQEFAISTSTVQWITTGYLLILAIVIPTSSYLKQRFAMKRLFLAANLLFLTGTLLDATSASFAQLLFGRLLQGAGTGIALPLMFLIVMEQAPLDKMGLMMGAAMLVCALAPAVGPSVGGYIVSTFGWRMIFIALLGLIVVGGIQATSRSYRRIVTYSNAQVVLADTMEVMRDQLLYVDGTAENGTHFSNANFGGFSYKSGSADGKEGRSISIVYDDTTQPVPLVSEGMMTKNLYARIGDDGIKVDDNTIQLTIEVCSTGMGETKDKVLASAELIVRPVNRMNGD